MEGGMHEIQRKLSKVFVRKHDRAGTNKEGYGLHIL